MEKLNLTRSDLARWEIALDIILDDSRPLVIDPLGVTLDPSYTRKAVR